MAKIGQDFHHLWENIHTLYERLKAHNTPKVVQAPQVKPAEPTWNPMSTAPESPKPILLLGRYTETTRCITFKPFVFIGTARTGAEIELLGWMPLPTTTVVADA